MKNFLLGVMITVLCVVAGCANDQPLTGLLSLDNGTITPDMNRVTLTVEGMTCPG
jgi:hypothetical protein